MRFSSLYNKGTIYQLVANTSHEIFLLFANNTENTPLNEITGNIPSSK